MSESALSRKREIENGHNRVSTQRNVELGFNSPGHSLSV
jgi:hypothetical protein